MAQSKNNIVTHGLSGKVGDLLVFSQRNGKTIVGKVPTHSGESTEGQKQVQQKFQQAVFYAKAAMANPETKAMYQPEAKDGKTIYNVAIADFFDAPDIQTVDFSAYHGQPGDVINIQVTDSFKVKAVSVTITNEDGSVVEQGEAQSASDGYNWLFTATQVNDSLSGDKITVRAKDMAANLSVKELAVS
ncbi:hypothetical protein GS399_18980 [Pedobacter sp. HMF7647]|uniref:Uncharacterized protein n=1 Tax=Hufsiella arboris TaxID=2695275 RepID=A0A7K1YF67_9SPHI|nr:hypothetical protein [Hufsiella arboris]MXV53060.1 hypothetical protein [Hufsiella arboris]